jgi:hypothetical protein
MQARDLFDRMGFIAREIDRLDKENPTGPDEETDPRIVQLLEEGRRIQKQLDPLVRETFRDRPEHLVEWDSIMHMCDDDLDEGDSGKSDL